MLCSFFFNKGSALFFLTNAPLFFSPMLRSSDIEWARLTENSGTETVFVRC
jgi:hypothetical protein